MKNTISFGAKYRIGDLVFIKKPYQMNTSLSNEYELCTITAIYFSRIREEGNSSSIDELKYCVDNGCIESAFNESMLLNSSDIEQIMNPAQQKKHKPKF